MAGSTPIYGFPYPEPSDLVANYPALGQQLAEDVETEIAASSVILQVVHSNYSTELLTTSGTAVDTGLTATITPTSATSKIYVVMNLMFRGQAADLIWGRVLRGSTTIFGASRICNTAMTGSWDINYVDSPATTSATTYKAQVYKDVAGGTAFICQWNGQQTSTLTLMEIKA